MFQDYQHMYIMKKPLAYAKLSAQAPEYSYFLRRQETMSDVEKGPRNRVTEPQNVCLEIQKVSSW